MTAETKQPKPDKRLLQAGANLAVGLVQAKMPGAATDFDTLARMKVKALGDYNITTAEFASCIEKGLAVKFTEDERKAMPNMSVETVVTMMAERAAA